MQIEPCEKLIFRVSDFALYDSTLRLRGALLRGYMYESTSDCGRKRERNAVKDCGLSPVCGDLRPSMPRPSTSSSSIAASREASRNEPLVYVGAREGAVGGGPARDGVLGGGRARLRRGGAQFGRGGLGAGERRGLAVGQRAEGGENVGQRRPLPAEKRAPAEMWLQMWLQMLLQIEWTAEVKVLRFCFFQMRDGNHNVFSVSSQIELFIHIAHYSCS